MSIRAYKLIEIKTEKEPTFSLWADERIRDIADESDGGDILTIQKEKAEEELSLVLAELKGLAGESDDEQAEELRQIEKILRNIITDCGEEEFCEYYCY